MQVNLERIEVIFQWIARMYVTYVGNCFPAVAIIDRGANLQEAVAAKRELYHLNLGTL